MASPHPPSRPIDTAKTHLGMGTKSTRPCLAKTFSNPTAATSSLSVVVGFRAPWPFSEASGKWLRDAVRDDAAVSNSWGAMMRRVCRTRRGGRRSGVEGGLFSSESSTSTHRGPSGPSELARLLYVEPVLTLTVAMMGQKQHVEISPLLDAYCAKRATSQASFAINVASEFRDQHPTWAWGLGA